MADPVEQTANAAKNAGTSAFKLAWKVATTGAMSIGAAFLVAHTGGFSSTLGAGILPDVTSIYTEAFTDVKDLVISPS